MGAARILVSIRRIGCFGMSESTKGRVMFAICAEPSFFLRKYRENAGKPTYLVT